MINLKKAFNWTLNLIIWGFCAIVTWLILQIFVFTSFRIPSDSMEPTLIEGDCVFVNKMLLGARIFNLNASIRGEQINIYRMPGVRKVKRNDVLVFNFPHPKTWDTIEMHIMKYYIKRCIALPGDTIRIENGFFKVDGVDTTLGNIISQQVIGETLADKFQERIYKAFPYNSILNWNIQNFGPLYIPKRGDNIRIDKKNYILYHKLIEWEQKKKTEYLDDYFWLDGEKLTYYRFMKNYYFVAGDKCENSQDSRYWGLLPEEYIVGEASFIWKSKDRQTNLIRWNRIFKNI